MAEIVNLSRARKTRDKADQRAQAEANRLKFGRTKSEKVSDKASAEALQRHVDAHKRDGKPE